jgi:cytoskeletal protein RodZ
MKKSSTRVNRYLKSPKKLWIGLVILLIIVGLLLWYNHNNTDKNTTDTTQTAAQKAEAQTEAQAKKDLIESSNQTTTPPTSNPPANTSTSITALSARQEDNGTVTIMTRLTSDTQGSCTLSITNGSRTYSKVVDIIYQPEFSTCAGFSVPINSLGFGNWNIALSSGASSKSIRYEVVR